MGKISFLINRDIWQTLTDLIKSGRHVDAAIAYFGTGGAKLLPLKRGDRLVVDMSPATVKAGATNPSEIEKLIARGVKVFTRRNLHAKIIVVGNQVLVGSTNVSKSSRDRLDEAAVLTNDSMSVRRAKEFLTRVCIEPLLPEYLTECKRLYKPPRITAQRSNTKGNRRRAEHAKLWLVNLEYYSLPISELDSFEKSEEKALKSLDESSSLSTFHWPRKPQMANELETGDWVIQCIRNGDKTISVEPPARFVFLDHYIRNQQSRTERYLFHLESPKRGERMTWTRLRSRLNLVLNRKLSRPRTMPIRDSQKADELLRLWTSGGRVSRR